MLAGARDVVVLMDSASPSRSLYLSRKMAALAGLGFASGLPYVLANDTLSAWLASLQFDVKKIGLFSLITLPYTFKFLWAPAMDRWAVFGRLLGRRRGWLVSTQILLAATLVGFALFGPREPGDSLLALGILGALLVFFSASQDIVADAYRADVVAPRELGAGAAVFVSGYRIAMIAGGALSLVLAERLGWSAAYLVLGALMASTALLTAAAPEPERIAPAPHSLAEAVVLPFAEFVRRHGGKALLVLVFVVVFRLPDLLANRMTMPLLLQHLQFSKEEVGVLRQMLGFAITIVGALAGGGIVARLGLFRGLVIFGVLQALSNAGFLVLASLPPSKPLLVAAIATESFCQGLVSAGFVAFLMSLCDPAHSATQYALLASLVALAGTVGGAVTGFMVAKMGYVQFFAWSIAAGIPGMAMLPWVGRTKT
jgi:PAT family beta-lactamase induction signal transducer AmpG